VKALASGLFVTLMLGACATSPPTSYQATPAGASLSGRLSVSVAAFNNVAARSENVVFELQGRDTVGSLSVSSAFGSVLAQARWTPHEVLLTTPQGEKRFADLNELTQDILGENLPLGALFDWLRGQPWPGAASMPHAENLSPGFDQLGWSVNLARFSDALVMAQRVGPPEVTVRIKLNAP
jgi:outer membrane lipoprotein LolB